MENKIKILGRQIWHMNQLHNNNDTRDWYALTPKERVAYRQMAATLNKVLAKKLNVSTYHTPECIQRTEDMDIALDLYAIKFPKACKECQGKGIIGSSIECALCVENGLCPRCASDIGYELGSPKCPDCKWNGPEDGFPPHPEPCDCPDIWRRLAGKVGVEQEA